MSGRSLTERVSDSASGPILAAGPAVVMDPAVATGPGTFHPSDFGIIDLHCHPSLKMYLWGRKLWKRHTPGLGINAFDLQDDVAHLGDGSVEPKLEDRSPDQEPKSGTTLGLVKGIIVSHYLPEKDMWDGFKRTYPWIKHSFRHLAGKLEHGDATNFDQINHIIDIMEDQVREDSQKQQRLPFVIATSYTDFKAAFDNQQFPIAHAIDGAHALGRHSPASQPDSRLYIDNLEKLKKRGVCMMTLAHLFPNDIAAGRVEGMSPDAKKKAKMNWTYENTPADDLHLTAIGVDVVSWMLKNGMIIDLTHSTPATRAQVFEINNGSCPIVFSHTGAQAIFNAYDAKKYFNFGYYCVSDIEIKAICACGGTIGIIPEVFWLAGGDTHLRRKGLPPKLFRNAIPYMVETIQYINGLTPHQDYSHISIGTNFDGFSDEPQDLYETSQLDALVNALRAENMSDDCIKKITSGNALSVLERGWR
jgi:microsomal dipeptidase-like Zn-dependent dipeptidase